MQIGLLGKTNVGKSTFFSAATETPVQIGNFPFTTIEPNVGIVDVPDERLQVLSDLSKSKKLLPATMTFVDIAGLDQQACGGTHLRSTDQSRPVKILKVENKGRQNRRLRLGINDS